jgi:diguanylate cyclase (GGDEF)-like protein/PAS domain S-box-containing protein
MVSASTTAAASPPSRLRPEVPGAAPASQSSGIGSASWLGAILDAIPEAIAVIDDHGVVVLANLAWRRSALEGSAVAGTPAAGAEIGADYLAFCEQSTEPEVRQQVLAGVRAILDGRAPACAHEYPGRGSPTQRWYSLRAQALPPDCGGAVIALLDVTEPKRAEALALELQAHRRTEAALAESEERWKFALEGAGDGVWDWNLQSGNALYSRRWKAMFGFDESEIADVASEWASRVHPDDLPGTMAAVQAHLDGRAPSAVAEFRMRCKDGSWKWTQGRGMLVSRDAQGQPLRLVGTNTDISERKRMEEQLHQFAFYDTLTRLPNRRLLDDRIGQAMAASKRSGRYGALMFLDLDNFKALNDSHGHAVGDLLLIEAAQRLKTCVREVDTVARFAGDEFVLLINDLDADPGASLAQARLIGEKVQLALAEPYRLTVLRAGQADNQVEYACTASVGVTLFLGHHASADDLLRWSDAAMYRAKKARRNSICFADSRV